MKWYKCPRCVRFCVLPCTKGFICHECLKKYTTIGFEKDSRNEFGETQFEIENEAKTRRIIQLFR